MAPPGPALPDEGGTNGSLLLVSVLLIALAGAAVTFTMDIEPLALIFRQGKRALGGLTGGAS